MDDKLKLVLDLLKDLDKQGCDCKLYMNAVKPFKDVILVEIYDISGEMIFNHPFNPSINAFDILIEALQSL